jgi:hypothetical protein
MIANVSPAGDDPAAGTDWARQKSHPNKFAKAGQHVFGVVQGYEGEWNVITTPQAFSERNGFCSDQHQKIEILMPKGAIEVQAGRWEFHEGGKINGPHIFPSAEAAATAMLERGFKWKKEFQDFCTTHDGHEGLHPIPGLEDAIAKLIASKSAKRE